MKKNVAAITVKEVSKTYSRADRPALENISLDIQHGERVGLIGGNGSGKTTLLRLVMNFLIPDSGSIRIFGEEDLENARRFMGILPERQTGLENFTPRELMLFSARMYSLSMDKARTRIADLLTIAELTDVADKLISGFSKGMAQRAQICNALIHDPPILLLDEPMSGLDPGGQKEVNQILKKLDGLTLLYATHQLSEIENLCTRAIILHQGNIIESIDLSDMAEEIYVVDITENGLQVIQGIAGVPIQLLEVVDGYQRVQFQTNPDHAQQLLARLSEAGESVRRLRSRGILESLYHDHTRGKK